MAITTGSQLGAYQILSSLGAGGMGEVYRARDTRLNREVAIKVLPASLVDEADRLLRFEQEAKAASALNHPNIITIHEVGEIKGLHFIVTELVDGQTLRREMAAHRLSLPAALDIAAQIASALAAAHEAGITHRDIKPENVMLRRDGIVKVLDFGLAKLTEQPRPAEIDVDAATRAKLTTDPGAVMGTPQYMSPEQARGQKVDARTDIFSLGVVLYEMIAGRPPFEGVNAMDVISAILQKEPQPLKSDAAEIPAELQRIVAKALRKDRNERYQTVRDLLNDLKDLKEELSFAAKQARSGQTERGQVVTAPAEAVPMGAGAALPTTSSAKIILGEIKRHQLGFALTLTLLVAAVGGYLAFFGGSRSGPIASLAVMPFVNASGHADAEYLSDGMTETLINALSQLPGLSIKARSSVFRYKGKEVDPQTVGSELNVQAIVNGRVVQRGDDLTLYLSLVDTRTGDQLWGEQYNRKQADLLSLQNAVARDVATKLRNRLSAPDEQKVARNYTQNTEAYQLYLQGRFFANKRTPQNIQKAIEYYQQAIAKDPNYALGYAGLSDGYGLLAYYGGAPAPAALGQARGAALRALSLDNNLAEAHNALAFVHGSSQPWRHAQSHRPAGRRHGRTPSRLGA
jgi:serine/threonine-protein kinase